MRKTLLLLGVGLAGIGVGVLVATYVAAQGAAQVTRTELLRKPVSGVEGKEVVVFVADLPVRAGRRAALRIEGGPDSLQSRQAHSQGDKREFVRSCEGPQLYVGGKGSAAGDACALTATATGSH